MLLRLYYVYEKSAKKSNELAGVVEELRGVFEFSGGGNLPIRSHGTRWITHKRRALQRILDQYGAYVHHLSTLAEDHSVKASDRERLVGYLCKWRKPRMLIGCALYTEALKPVSILSLSLQKEGADIVMSIENTLKAVKALKLLSEKDTSEWPTIQLVKSRLKEVDAHMEYQGVEVKNFDDVLKKQCTVQVKQDVGRLNEKIKSRLEWSDVHLMRSILIFVEMQSWQLHSDDEDNVSEVSEAAEYIVSLFRIPLEARGMSAELIGDEIENVACYARKYLPIGTENYRKIWYKIFTSPDSAK